MDNCGENVELSGEGGFFMHGCGEFVDFHDDQPYC